MRIALVDLCRADDFAKHPSYVDSISFLREEGIDFLDFATGTDSLDAKVQRFHEALKSDADLVWVIRGGLTCITVLDKIDWDLVTRSGKSFYGLSDFTHFSAMAALRGVTCYYGQGLKDIMKYLPKASDRAFVASFLKTGEHVCAVPQPLLGAEPIDLRKAHVVGGHILLFNFMQRGLNLVLKDRYVFIEYHSAARGEGLDDLGYYLDQLLYACNENKPKGFILGHIELEKADHEQIETAAINDYCARKLSSHGPVHYVDHFTNTIKFS